MAVAVAVDVDVAVGVGVDVSLGGLVAVGNKVVLPDCLGIEVADAATLDAVVDEGEGVLDGRALGVAVGVAVLVGEASDVVVGVTPGSVLMIAGVGASMPGSTTPAPKLVKMIIATKANFCMPTAPILKPLRLLDSTCARA